MSEPHKVKLLISVRNEQEALDALAGGADWIDLKEPSAGPLAPVGLCTAERVIDVVDGRCPLSAALGEIVDWPYSAARQLVELPGIAVVKLGPAGCAPEDRWKKVWLQTFEACLNEGKNLAAVIYADWMSANAPHQFDILRLAIDSGCRYLVIDTFDKSRGSCLTALAEHELRGILNIGREHKMTCVLAGNLRASDFSQIAQWSIDMVAVRGAACSNGRASRVDRDLVRNLHRHLSQNSDWETELPTSLATLDLKDFA